MLKYLKEKNMTSEEKAARIKAIEDEENKQQPAKKEETKNFNRRN